MHLDYCLEQTNILIGTVNASTGDTSNLYEQVVDHMLDCYKIIAAERDEINPNLEAIGSLESALLKLKTWVEKCPKPKTERIAKVDKEPELSEASKKIHKTAAAQFTTDYDMFKFIMSNRDTDRTHVKKLAKAIREKNLLHLNPIIVNENYEVIDGQHRLEAAKMLGLPIYYNIDSDVTQEDISGMNSNKKNWTVMDYVNFYTINKKPDFVAFAALCQRFPDFSAPILMTIIGGDGKKNYEALKRGEIDVTNIDKADIILSKLQDFKDAVPQIANSARFIEAFTAIFLHVDYDHSRMLKKLQTCPSLFIPCLNKKAYIQMLQSIYNRGQRDESIVTFIKR